jgi:membrane protein involved in colicin uptake
MKREDLKAMGLTDEQIDKIMAENGKDIEKYKSESETLKATNEQQKTQLEEANKQIESFKGMDIEGIKKAADDYKTKFEEAEKNHKAELDKITYDATAEKFINSLKPKDDLSKKAILAEFKAKEFKLEGESFVGGKEWVEQFKKDNATHFLDGDGNVTTVSSGGGHGDPLAGDVDKFVAAAMKGAGIAQENNK